MHNVMKKELEKEEEPFDVWIVKMMIRLDALSLAVVLQILLPSIAIVKI